MDADRLKAITLYICARFGDRAQSLTVAQLHHILWHADGETYIRLGRALVGEEYVRAREGPSALHLEAALNELRRGGWLDIQPAQHNIQVDQVLIARGASDLSFLSADERKILDELIERVVRNPQHLSGGLLWEVRDSEQGYGPVAGHQAWKAAAIGERIAYQQQLLERLPPLTNDDAEWVASELKARR